MTKAKKKWQTAWWMMAAGTVGGEALMLVEAVRCWGSPRGNIAALGLLMTVGVYAAICVVSHYDQPPLPMPGRPTKDWSED